ncbi:MAG: hypothetical protein HZB67_06090 [Candidatus Aenigmarchaeota archaeon]|nr:hypothetical protein [Candidatus Aenigmarchaeota archaeon]
MDKKAQIAGLPVTIFVVIILFVASLVIYLFFYTNFLGNAERNINLFAGILDIFHI